MFRFLYSLHSLVYIVKIFLKELIEAVRRNDLTEAYKLVFSGADPNCATGKEHAKTRKVLLCLFLYGNQLVIKICYNVLCINPNRDL